MEYNLNTSVPLQDQRPILTEEEMERLVECLFYFDFELGVFSRISGDEHLDKTPWDRLLLFAEIIGCDHFVRELLKNTLEIYHEAREWLPIFYGVALLCAENTIDLIVEYLISIPRDHAAFILKALSQIVAEMTEQIAVSFTHVPYCLPEPRQTRNHFAYLYSEALSRLAILKERLAVHNRYI